MTGFHGIKTVRTPQLEIAYEESGSMGGRPVLLLHGFPYDIRAYDQVAREVAAADCRVIVPYLRGYGPTRFLSPETLRSGQQAALGQDLLAFMDALDLPRAILAGYDWGARAACIVAALWPQRVAGLVSVCGYMIQNIAVAASPVQPETEHLLWYQYYFHTARGETGLSQYRREFCRLLWSLWSPTWKFDDATYARTALSFDNPDFVDIVIHSQPSIGVPTIVLHGQDDGVVPPPEHDTGAHLFTGSYRRRVTAGAGHNLPQEAPHAMVEAIRELL
jgi:pimeloyl-ACP methyl ester carboxylesterase